MDIEKLQKAFGKEEQSITVFDFPNSSVPCVDEVLSYVEWLRKIQKELQYPTKLVFREGLCALVPILKYKKLENELEEDNG